MNNEPNISLYGDGAGEDFPVLKAFQQYIDAEQAKARRRLLTVSIVFVITLISVIAIFSVLVIKANDQTQMLNNKMVELLLKDKDRSIEEAKTTAIQEATVKSLNETLEKMQKRIEDQERKASEAAAAAAREIAAAKAYAAEAPSVSDPVLDKRAQQTEARIQKALAKLKAEKEKLAADKEKLRQEELERYRREHYPEYYAKKEAAEKAASGSYLDEDEDDNELEPLTYFDDEPEKTVKPVQQKSSKPKTKPAKDSVDDAIEYFNNADSYTIPVEVKGKRAGWRVPLD